MDLANLLSNHPIVFDPLNLIMCYAIFLINSEIVKMKISNARRETKLDELGEAVNKLIHNPPTPPWAARKIN